MKTGYFAVVLGLATVVLPPGWEKRMVELKAENGEVVALCAEVHDVAVSKLMAGRQKDFDFLKTLFESDYLQVETFLKRLEVLVGTPSSAAIEVRVQALTEILEKERNLHKLAARIRTFAKKL